MDIYIYYVYIFLLYYITYKGYSFPVVIQMTKMDLHRVQQLLLPPARLCLIGVLSSPLTAH